jgi:hypothetical protein
LGGISEIMFLIFGFLFYPMSRHSFHVQAIEKLYLAKTIDKATFPPKK